MTEAAPSLPRLLGTGLVAGVAGSIVLDLYVMCASFAGPLPTSMAVVYRYVAEVAIGKAALTNPNAIWLGAAIQFAIGIGWGIGYVYAASRTRTILERPIVSGMVFGLIVYLTMQIVAVAANAFHAPDTALLVNGLVANTLFFGLPIALVTRYALSS